MNKWICLVALMFGLNANAVDPNSLIGNTYDPAKGDVCSVKFTSGPTMYLTSDAAGIECVDEYTFKLIIAWAGMALLPSLAFADETVLFEKTVDDPAEIAQLLQTRIRGSINPNCLINYTKNDATHRALIVTGHKITSIGEAYVDDDRPRLVFTMWYPGLPNDGYTGEAVEEFCWLK